MSAAAGAERHDFTWCAVEILALTTLCIAQLVESIDVTVVNVALPAIRTGLGFSESSLQWVVSAYTALFGGCLLLGGRCGDLFGNRAVFTAGVSSCTAASLVCGVAQSETVLIAGRGAQGFAAAFRGSHIARTNAAGDVPQAAAASDAISVGFVASATLMAIAGVSALVALGRRPRQPAQP